MNSFLKNSLIILLISSMLFSQDKYDEDKYVKEHQEIIYDFHFRNNLNINNTRKLLSLIYLNMAPLHEPPFDILLLALANKIFWSND